MANNIFISHFSKDVERMRTLILRLRTAGKKVRNSSAEEDVDTKIQPQKHIYSDAFIAKYLRARIKWAGTFILLIGNETYKRPWVNYEIRCAARMGKPIIGVYEHGCKGCVELPEAFKRYGGSIIGWNSINKLSDIIDGTLVSCETIDGTPAMPIYNIITIKC